jgi:hypothetical protein
MQLAIPYLYVAFVPLDKEDIAKVAEQFLLRYRYAWKHDLDLTWSVGVVDFLSTHPRTMYTADGFATGAAQVGKMASIYVNNPLKNWIENQHVNWMFAAIGHLAWKPPGVTKLGAVHLQSTGSSIEITHPHNKFSFFGGGRGRIN